ncbi:MAG TPA: heparinase II/III family protein [Candidatus Hydrogenedentes bacterium]|nr:heparinase II/III family protein [Candidatus Hydrogenedentota bacterium]
MLTTLAVFMLLAAPDKPLARDALVIRGRADHPCVNITAADIERAKARAATYAWAQHERDEIVTQADSWLRESGAYWLQFLPKPGACYAYGFTGCPICDGKTGTWAKANCTWDNPGHVKCGNGHVLPDAEHPDTGEGFKAPDGRIHYFAGQFNAWVTEQWTLNALPNLTQAYALTGEEKYAARAALLLDALASIYAESTSGSWDYPSNPPSGRFARPWYQVARTLVYYVDQFDLIHRSPALDEPSLRPKLTRRENIQRYLLEDGAYYCYGHSFDGVLHNGHADYMRGALAVGCLLDIPEYIRISIEGPYSIRSMLANNIDRDGRYYETSPGYAIHARALYETFADPLHNLRNAEYPSGINLYDDPQFAACLLLPEMQIQCAGRLPNFGDAAPNVNYNAPPERPFSTVDAGFLERLCAMSSNPKARAEYGATLLWLAKGGLDAQREDAPYRNWLLWHACEPPDSPPELPPSLGQRITGSWAAGMKGLAILRDGRQTALLRFGPSLNHGDPDDLALQYYADGYEWTYDLGYGLGSTHCHVGWASSTVSHCLVTVDEKNQLGTDGSGGSLKFFADLPAAKVVQATSELSYAEQGVTHYQRTVALIDGTYLMDVFEVTGGKQHDFGFCGLGEAFIPFGAADLKPQEGSLAEGVAWGQRIGADGDVKGYPNKPYWNPPPGNGYGFFYDIRRGAHEPVWGGQWSMAGTHPALFRAHLAGDTAEAIVATGPGLYPHYPTAHCLMARRQGENLHSIFLAIYESIPEERPSSIDSIRRLGPCALEVHRKEGHIDVISAGSCEVDSALGHIIFQGDFAYITGEDSRIRDIQTAGCVSLRHNDQTLDTGPAEFAATITAVDYDTCVITLDRDVPPDLCNLVAVFSNPAYSRTTAYHIRAVEGNNITLQASSLNLGVGRVEAIVDAKTITSGIPHEYARSVKRHSTRFFDGKRIQGEHGGAAQILATKPGAPLTLTLDDTGSFQPGQRFFYRDIAPGDTLRIPRPRHIQSSHPPR